MRSAPLGQPGDQGIPGRNISPGHISKYLPRGIEVARLCIPVEQGSEQQHVRVEPEAKRMAVELGGLDACKSTGAGLEGEGAGERVDPAGEGAEGGDVPVEGSERVGTDGCAAEESVEVVGEGAGGVA